MSIKANISVLFTVAVGIMIFISGGFPQTVLYEDEYSSAHWFDITHMEDTLRGHDAVIRKTSEERWQNLMDMDMLWIYLLHYRVPPVECPYSESDIDTIVAYSRSGGKISFWPGSPSPGSDSPPLNNPLFMDDDWETTVEIVWEYADSFLIRDFFSFPPLTESIDTVGLNSRMVIMTTGNHAYPFAFGDYLYSIPVMAICYPFLHENRCDQFILVIMGTHQWQTWWHDPDRYDNLKCMSNVLCVSAGCEGYELPPCAVPEPFEIEVDSVPECANPGDTIILTGRNLWQGGNENIGGDIEIYFYGPQDTVVIPFEYSDHRPAPHSLYNTWLKFICPDLPNGEYEIELGHKAITFYAGSITIPCDMPYYPCTRIPNPFTPNDDGIYDEVEFTFPGIGENEGVIKIFTLGNLKVRTIEVPAGAGAKEIATWDGTDNAGEPLLQGIYLYIIKSQGRIICKGTITLVR